MWFHNILPILVIVLLTISITLIDFKSSQNYRLNTNVKPYKYDILIQPYLLQEDGDNQFSFDGEVNISLLASKIPSKQFALHKKEINIKAIRLYDKFQNQIQYFKDDEMIYHPLTDQLILTLIKPLILKTNYTLYIKYAGIIRDDPYGLFRYSYDNMSWEASALFQPLDARLALPCFDEPEFKAKFRLSIIRPRTYKSFFNTKLLTTIKKGGQYETDIFDYTPFMSTYLLAFMVVSNYNSYGDGNVKIITPFEMLNESFYSYKVAVGALEFYDTYLKIPYKQLGNPLLQISFTNKYKYLALENWGLVIFRDSIIRQISDYTDGLTYKQRCISTILHEIAHMWFGNSVTLKWWSYFWLNEAFARYLEVVIGDLLYPAYKFEQQFIIHKIHFILDIDAKIDSPPMTSNEESINTANEINSKLNRITYEKGASVLRMFSNAMGKNNFDLGMNDYLKENHLQNTTPKDVFKHLRKHWPKYHKVDLKQFFQDWTEQAGYPMLIVTTTSRNEYKLKQQRFLVNNKSLKNTSLTYTIPITYTTDKEMNFENLTPKFYFNKTLPDITFGNIRDHKWLIVNLQQSSYCRVFYANSILKNLRKAFMAHNHSSIHVINRASIVDDLFAFARKGLMSYKKVFHFMEYLANETEYLPWKAAFKGFDVVCKRLSPQQHKEFGKLLFNLTDLVYRKLGFENTTEDTVLDVYNRNQIIQWLCRYHHERCNRQAQRIFRSHLSANTKPITDLRETLYCAGCRYDETEIYGNLSQMFKNCVLLSEKEKILRAMACTRHNVENLFKFLLSNNVSPNLKTIGLRALYSQTFENIMSVFQLMMGNFEQVAKVLQGWTATASVICDISQYLTTPEQLSMLKNLVKYHGNLLGKSLKMCVETVEKNLVWDRKRLKEFDNYLNEFNKENEFKMTT